MKKIISTVLAFAFIGATALTAVGCKKEETTQISKTEYLKTLEKAMSSFLGAHTIGDDDWATAEENYKATNYGEFKAVSSVQFSTSNSEDVTYTENETEKTVTLHSSSTYDVDSELNVKKVGDYYYLRKTETVKENGLEEEFDEEDKKVYKEMYSSNGTVQYDLGALVNGENVTYYYAVNETETVTESSNDPSHSETSTETITEKEYVTLSANEYYETVLEILEENNENIFSEFYALSETGLPADFTYEKTGDNYKVKMSAYEIVFNQIDFCKNEIPVVQGYGEIVITEKAILSYTSETTINDDPAMSVKMSVQFFTSANLTPLSSLEGYEENDYLDVDLDNFAFVTTSF